jgi:hypothetical protein
MLGPSLRHGAIPTTPGRPVTWLFAPLAAITSACGDDKPPAPPPEPPALEIQAVRAIGGSSWSPGGDKPLELGCTPSPVLVELGPSDAQNRIGDWILRPPADCGGERKCGFVTVIVDPSNEDASTVDSASTAVQVELSSAGKHIILAELRAENGSGVATDGGRVTCQETLTVVLPRDSDCSAAGDASAD